jgi:hypothetical protein
MAGAGRDRHAGAGTAHRRALLEIALRATSTKEGKRVGYSH